jgi:PEP-CTERM motif-containing protein
MKKLAAIVCLSALTTGAFAQGLVTFVNQAGTQVSSGSAGNTAAISGAAGSYYFGLLTSSAQGGPFTFAGNYATNSVTGRLAGGPNTGVTVTGWQPGATMFFEVAGWSASLGHDFQNTWVKADGSVNTAAFPGSGFFGVSSIASGIAGGGPNSLPPQPLFGSAGVSGFNLNPIGGATVPEPSSMALAGLGAAALLIFRRRK